MAQEKIWFKSYAPGVPHEIDFEKMTLPEALKRSARNYPESTALLFMGKHLSYAELDRLVNRFARALLDLGVKKGEKVALLLPNLPQAVIAIYAAFRIGAVAVMNNPLYTERELEYQFNDSDSKVLVSLDLLHPRILKIKDKTKIEKVIYCHINDYLPFPKKQLFPLVKKQMYRKFEPREGFYEFLPIIQKYTDTPVENASNWEETGAFIYTGGTTGVSKGVMLTHANLSCNVQQFSVWFPDLKKGAESVLAVFPFFHSAGFTAIMNLCIWNGYTDILVPRPEPATVMEMVKKFKPNYLPAVPTIFVGLLNTPEFRQMDLSFIKGFFSGAAPLAADTLQQMKDLTGATMLEVYGLTETTPIATVTPWGGKIKPGTVGTPVPSTDVKIVDVDTGKEEQKIGTPGEIIVKGPQVMKGYYKQPEETAHVLKDGWLYTGDIGMFDEDGYLTIVDRKKDMIIAGGYNIYPREIDEILFQHPKILEACSIGVPDAYRGETVKAYVVVKPGETLTADEVIQFSREKLAAYKAPKMVEFIDALPKSAVGKILRKEVKDMDRKKSQQKKA
ncbi:MAG: long-chain fatty acid--CoA ligase [Deltaproteobacteria bacterium]|jgi:long-chain acyl-CoA synthetase|nr:long-chain fatty acid--CoA ligase [Deltaproteobacteria bacterium]